YSVLHYYIDDERIGSLIDQSGKEAGVEIITTFLPKVVIESLLAALERADLNMKALTLEPIAAIHVLVPQSMRRLNVALIDISDAYLLDFKEAERVKQQVINEKSSIAHDILGLETEVTYEALVEQISHQIERLSQLLGEEVLKLNANVPQAVMLIGGGSMTPNIADQLAAYLNLPKNRVAIRGIDGVSVLDKDNQHVLPNGPDFVTPIGIAISATENPLHYTNVY